MKVSFFGSLAETIGREVDLPVTAGMTAGAVRRQLIAIYPSAAEALARPAVRACVDNIMVEDEYELEPGATLGFLPPLSGG